MAILISKAQCMLRIRLRDSRVCKAPLNATENTFEGLIQDYLDTKNGEPLDVLFEAAIPRFEAEALSLITMAFVMAACAYPRAAPCSLSSGCVSRVEILRTARSIPLCAGRWSPFGSAARSSCRPS